MNIEERNLEVTRQETSLAELSKNTQMLEETERTSSLANLEKKRIIMMVSIRMQKSQTWQV